MNRMARQGEADRHTTGALTKHLVSCFRKQYGRLNTNIMDRLLASAVSVRRAGDKRENVQRIARGFMMGVQDASDTTPCCYGAVWQVDFQFTGPGRKKLRKQYHILCSQNKLIKHAQTLIPIIWCLKFRVSFFAPR